MGVAAGEEEEEEVEVRKQVVIVENFSHLFSGMPTIEEVCSTFGLQDVDIEYSESDFQNLTSYKLFQQHVRPLLTKENPKVGVDNENS